MADDVPKHVPRRDEGGGNPSSEEPNYSEHRRMSQVVALKDETDPVKRAERLKWKQCSILQGFTEKKYLLFPKTPFMQRWDTILGVLLLYTAFITPYEVAFLATSIDSKSAQTMFGINRIVDLFFFTDLFFNFNLFCNMLW